MVTVGGSPATWYQDPDMWSPTADWPRADSHIHLVKPAHRTWASARSKAGIEYDEPVLYDTHASAHGIEPSYGGLLWCLGWRDRPGTAGKPKARPTSTLGRRIKPGDLERQVTKQHKHIQTHIHAQSRTQHLIPNTQYPAHKR